MSNMQAAPILTDNKLGMTTCSTCSMLKQEYGQILHATHENNVVSTSLQ